MGLGISIRVNGAPDRNGGLGGVSSKSPNVSGKPTNIGSTTVSISTPATFLCSKKAKLGPGSEISVLVPTPGTTECLVKGPVYGQEIHLRAGRSRLFTGCAGRGLD